VPELAEVILVSAVGAIGILVASLALAMPNRAQLVEGAEMLLPAYGNLRSQTWRERVNRPFEVLADRSSQRRRLNGGLTLAEHLTRANLKLRPSEFVMIQVAFLIAWAAISLLRFGFGPQFVIAGVVGYLVPMRYVRYRQRQRLKALNRQLPDTLSLLSNALKAGLSLPQALDTVARNTTAPIADELSRVIREMNIGSPTERALAAMVRRTGSEDLDLIVTAIGIQASVGGNLARILESISHTIRQRVQVKGQISAMTAQARASGWVITLLPVVVAVILYVITPTYFRAMFQDRLGIGLLLVAGLSILVGNFFIRRVVNFRV
jgi:tight adherence protein B